MLAIHGREGARNDWAQVETGSLSAMALSVLDQQRAAYGRARAAFDRLQSLTDRLNTEYVQGLKVDSLDDWMELKSAYNHARQEWDDAFAAFDGAVHDYAATLRGNDSPDCSGSVNPRKPR